MSVYSRGKLERQVCKRTNKVFGLTLRTGSTESTDAYWQEFPEYALTKAKSGHVLLSVPESYADFCNEV